MLRRVVVLVVCAFLLFSPGDTSAGSISVDPLNARWLFRDGAPIFLSGPGDPENFLFRGTLNPDGTRSGDQQSLIDRIDGEGANTIWSTAVRSHGGDGLADENPFINQQPSQGVNPLVLNQWAGWFEDLDAAGVTILFTFYDDDCLVWNTGNVVGAQEEAFIQAIVNRFEGIDHLIWNVCEEYQEVFLPPRVSAIAARIDFHDDFDHPIAVHQLQGTVFDFADDPIIDVFAMQMGGGNTPPGLHTKVVNAFGNAAGRYCLIMSEAINHFSGDRAAARKLSWASAMGGGYVMAHNMTIANTPLEVLQDHGRIASFFEAAPFTAMVPADDAKRSETEYVLGAPGVGYIAYGAEVSVSLGLHLPAAAAGACALRWLDCVTGTIVVQPQVPVVAGDNTWTKPAGMGLEIALSIVPAGATGLESEVGRTSWGRIKETYR